MKFMKKFTDSKINESKLIYMWCMQTKDYDKIPFYLSYSNENPLESEKIGLDQGDYWEIDFKSDKYKTSPTDDSLVLIPKSDVIRIWVEPLKNNLENLRYINKLFMENI